ncbi:ATP-binding protein [candidate division KSB1 bacterium]|nr:ATP-binding protein [candidate division KSB1 bacterium]
MMVLPQKYPVSKVLFFLHSVLFSFGLYGQPPSNFEFNILNKKVVQGAQPIDINQDGEDEIFVLFGDEIDIFDAQILTHQAFFGVPAMKYAYVPLSTGRLDSLAFIAIRATKDSVYWNLLIRKTTRRLETRELKRYITFSGLDKDQDGIYHQSGGPFGTIKNKTGQQLLLFTLNTARDAAKRGIMAVRPETGEIVWEFLCGPQVLTPIIVDLDGDEEAEIVFGSYAPDNHFQLNGTQDDSSYIFLINCEGKPIWRKPMGGVATGTIPGVKDLNGDNQPDLIAFRYSNQETSDDPDELVRIDFKTGKSMNHISPGGRISIPPNLMKHDFCQDLNQDGQAEIVIGSRDGVVRMYDFDFKMLHNSAPLHAPVGVTAFADLNGDGLQEVICRTADFRVLVFTHELNLLGEQEVPSQTEIKKVQTKSKNYLLFTVPAINNQFEIQLIEFRWFSFAKQTIQQIRIYLEWLLTAGVILGLFYLIRNWLLGRDTLRIFMDFLKHADLQTQALVLRKNLRLVYIGEKWQALLKLKETQNLQRTLKEVLDEKSALFTIMMNSIKAERAVQPYKLENQPLFLIQTYYLTLPRLLLILLIDLREKEYVHQVKNWASMAQRLAHGIKNPLTTIKLNAEDLSDLLQEKYQINSPEVMVSIQDIIDQADRLTRMTDGFMRFSNFEKPVLESIDINQKLNEWLPQWLPSRPRIECKYDLAPALPLVRIDLQQVETAFKNIVMNAIQSMPEGGKLIISTRNVELFPDAGDWSTPHSFVEIEIRDTGKGFPKEFREKVFEPYFSYQKKGGTGLGLTLVKKIIVEHGGEIFIDSEEGAGTQVSIRLPAQK